MKKFFFAFLALASTSTIFAQKKVADVAKLNFQTFDFGKVKQNAPATATFVVTNIGSENLLIEKATPTCGCTISDYTKSPIAPGKTGTIKATYDAKNVGAIHKTLSVKFVGIDEIQSINLAGEVLEPTAHAKWMAENKSSIKVKDNGAKIKTETKTNTGTTKIIKKAKA